MSRQLLCVVLIGCVACRASDAESAAPEASQVSPGLVAALGSARATLDAGKPRDALIEIDALVERAPGDSRVWLLRGEACLEAARNDSEPAFYYADALSAFERAIALGAGRQALLGASVASRMKLLPYEALAYARRAVEGNARLEPWETRIAIEATFDAYIRRLQAGTDPEDLYGETETRLLELLAETPDDPWALHTLANLFGWGGQKQAAVEPLAHLIDIAPNDETAHNRFVAVMREVEGRNGVIAHYTAFHARHPVSALGAWYLAAELFEQAVDELWARRDSTAAFTRAEQLFGECRTLAPANEQSCKGYEVMCRNGVGWCRYNAGDFEGAARAFWATEDALQGGLQWQIEGRLLSAVKGLQLIADGALRESEGGDDSESPGLVEAATIFKKLRALVPNDVSIANNSGFFHRELGVQHLWNSRKGQPASSSKPDAVKQALQDERFARERDAAKEALLESRDAYVDAARIAPDDVRIVNDAALILVYHFPSEVDEAERMLTRAVELGRVQKDDSALDAEARDALLEAWGDAHQNLGVLHLMLRGDPATAREWFDVSFEIGPRPRIDRAWIRDVALPCCDRVAAGEALDSLDLDERIGSVE